jgi:ribonucleoside-diphosphate reductase alpha chain
MANPQGIGPQTEFSDQLHAMKYRGKGEDFREAMNRVSFGLKDSDRHYHELRDVLLPMRFMPGGRIQSAIGAVRQVTPYNCFVSGTIADSFTDGDGCIMQRAHEAAATMRMGGGIGYNFSTLRPRNSLIRRLQSHSSGPVSFMRVFNEVCLCTSSSGHRRGAQMCVFRIDHPDIEEYIRAKQNTTELLGFNLSVGVTNEFMECVQTGRPFDLRWGGEVHRTVDAQALWEMLMRSTWDWGEPGVIYLDRINEMNNLWYCEQIEATNPCAEQPLPPFGACLLGSFNLTKYLIPAPGVREASSEMGNTNWALDFDLLRQDIPCVVRAMDNVVDRAIYPLPQQKAEAITKRRMGLGVTGLANALEATGRPYGSAEFLEAEDTVLDLIEAECYRASALLAAEKGPFALFDKERYLRGPHIKELPEDVLDLIDRHGIRNSHLTSIAPTGTISMCADYISSVLEPVFDYEVHRPVNTPDGQVTSRVPDYGAGVLGVRGRLAHDVTAAEHVSVQVVAQKHSDSAVSKTVNMDGTKMPWDEFKHIYVDVWERGGKSCSTFNSTGKRMGLIRASSDEEGAACRIDPDTGVRDCA